MQENYDGLSKFKLIMKGASEILIKKCDRIVTSSGVEVPLNDVTLDSFHVGIFNSKQNQKGICVKRVKN